MARRFTVSIAAGLLLAVTAFSAPALGAWTATCNTLAGTVTFSGSGALILSDSGGVVAHNQAGTFAEPTDCDSSTPGTQTVSTPAQVTVSASPSPATLGLGAPASSADTGYAITATGVSGDPVGSITYSGLTGLLISTGSGADVFTVFGLGTGTPLT